MSWFACALGGLALASDVAEDAKSCLEVQLAELWRDGVRSRPIESAVLRVGETKEVELLLYGGFEVTFRGCAGAGGTDLDLLLVDAEGNILKRDGVRSRDPVLVVEPPTTGRYRIVAYLRAVEGAVGDKAVPVAFALTFGS